MSKVKPAPLLPDSCVSGYRILCKLAAGGFGIVYLATAADGQRVAVKEYMPAALASRQPGECAPTVAPEHLSLYRLGLESFFEEGRALAQISHASVVSVHNFFRENDTVYMVMDYLEGASLQDYLALARDLQQPHVLSEPCIRSLFDELLRGLRVVHQHKMLHLDIKPANIFVTDDDRAVLIDFGSARGSLGHDDHLVRPMYTPGFAAPELYRRDVRLDPGVDIYAIGACIYACLHGYPPPDAMQRQAGDRLSVHMAQWRGIYSDALIDIILWCMQMDPMNRPQSVHDLQKALSGAAVRVSAPPSATERLRQELDHWAAHGFKPQGAARREAASP